MDRVGVLGLLSLTLIQTEDLGNRGLVGGPIPQGFGIPGRNQRILESLDGRSSGPEPRLVGDLISMETPMETLGGGHFS